MFKTRHTIVAEDRGVMYLTTGTSVKWRLYSCPFHRQIHPVCEDRTQLLAYENKPTSAAILATSPSLPLDPPSYPAPPPLPTYPLTPNICVEGGRIEFIKTPPDVATDRKFPPTPTPTPSPSSSTLSSQQAQTVTRAQQTVDEDEKTDVAKVGGSTWLTGLSGSGDISGSASVKVTGFRDVARCNLVETGRHFRGA